MALLCIFLTIGTLCYNYSDFVRVTSVKSRTFICFCSVFYFYFKLFVCFIYSCLEICHGLELIRLTFDYLFMAHKSARVEGNLPSPLARFRNWYQRA